MTGPAKRFKTKTDFLIDAKKEIRNLHALDRYQFNTQRGTNVSAGATPGAGGSAGSVGNYLPTSGGTMAGPIAYYPVDVTIVSGRINIGQFARQAANAPFDHSTYVLVAGAGTPDDLNWIDSARFAGQDLVLQGTNTQVINLVSAKWPSISNITGTGTVTVTTSASHGLVTGQIVNIKNTTNFNVDSVTITVTGASTFTYSDAGGTPAETSGNVIDGNVLTNDGNTIVLDGSVNTTGIPVIRLIFDVTAINGGAWRPLAGAGIIGANRFLSNLESTTAINSSLVPDTPGSLDLGSDVNYWDQLKAQEIKFLGSKAAPAGTSTEISVDASGDMQFGLVDVTDSYKFYFNGVLRGSIRESSSLGLVDFDIIEANNQFVIQNSAVDPAINGIFTNNAGDVKVYSGGAVRNLSDIGSGGANTALSNLIATSINQALVPDGAGTRDLGSDANYWDQLKVQEIKFLGSKTAPGGTSTEITVDASGDMQFGLVDVTDSYKFYFNGVLRGTIRESSSLGIVDFDIIEANNQFVIQSTGVDPAINGVFTNNTGNVKVYSGGVLRNFSDIISNPANDTLSNLGTTSINATLTPDGAGTRDLGTDANYWDQVKVQEVKFLGSVAAPAGTTTEISVDASGDMQFGLVDVTDAYKFYFNGVLRGTIRESSSLGIVDFDIIEANNQVVIQNSAVDPAINGVFTTNGADVKVYSGGAVRNLSDVGGGSSNIISQGNSNVEVIDAGSGLVNIDVDGVDRISVTATQLGSNIDFDLNGNEIIDLGNIQFTDGGVSLGNTARGIWHQGTNMISQVATGEGYLFKIAANTEFGIGPTTIDFNNNKGINAVDPTANQDVATKKYVDDNAISGDGIQDVTLNLTHETAQFDHQIWLSHSKQGDLDEDQTSSVYAAAPQEAIYFYPFYIGKPCTIQRIGVDVGTLNGNDWSVAIYDNNSDQNYPGGILSSSFNGNILGTGIQSQFVDYDITTPGLYWIAMWFDNGAVSTIRGIAAQACNCVGWATANDTDGALEAVICYVETGHTSPTMPSTPDNDMSPYSFSMIPQVFAKIVPT